jgi:hypothetical protein
MPAISKIRCTRRVLVRADHRQRALAELVQPQDGADEHADGRGVDEAHGRQVEHQPPPARVDAVVDALPQLRAGRVVDLAAGDEHGDIFAKTHTLDRCVVTDVEKAHALPQTPRDRIAGSATWGAALTGCNRLQANSMPGAFKSHPAHAPGHSF